MSSEEGRSFREFGAQSLRLLSLCAFAVAQPLYDVLGSHAQFFVSRGSEALDVAFFVVAISLGVPALAIGVVEAAGLLGARVRSAFSVAVCSALVAAIVLPLLNRAGAAPALALAACAGLGLAYGIASRRASWLRSFTTALSPAALLFPALFVFATPVSKLVMAETGPLPLFRPSASDTPLIFIVLDLLPTAALMDEERRIDAVRYPAFADLARHSHWFRNATSIAGNTVLAVPAILTGTRPRERALALAVDYPANLFTWLAPTRSLAVFESETRLCPPNLCGKASAPPLGERVRGMALDTPVVFLHLLLPAPLRAGLPPISAQWHGFTEPERTRESKREERHELIRKGRSERRSWGRIDKFFAFIARLEAPDPPGLAYLHLPLPHEPFVFLPSGQRYVPRRGRLADTRLLRGVLVDASGLRSWNDSAEDIRLGYQRMTLQIGFVDHLLGGLLEKLRRLDLFDRSLIVIVADHGMSFVEGARTRSEMDGSTLFVPLFVKLPGQDAPVVDDRNAQTLDLLPTVADALGMELPWSVEGRSLFAPADDSRRTKRVVLSRSRRRATGAGSVEHSDWPRLFEQSLEQKLRLTRSGPMDRIYRTGPHGELVGLSLAELRSGVRIGGTRFVALAQTRGRVSVEQRRYLAKVEPMGLFVPAYLTGSLRLPGQASIGRDLVVVLNGVVCATTRAEPVNERTASFAVMLPPDRLVRGQNYLQFLVATAVSVDEIQLQPAL